MSSWAAPPSCQPPVDERVTIGVQGCWGFQAKDEALLLCEAEVMCTFWLGQLHIRIGCTYARSCIHVRTLKKRPQGTVLLNDVRMLLVGRAEGIVNEDTSFGVIEFRAQS